MAASPRWTPPRAALIDEAALRDGVPACVRWAVGLLVFHAVASGGPIAAALLLGFTSPSLRWQHAFSVAGLAMMVLELAIAALPLWRRPWPRVVLAVQFAFFLGDYVVVGDMGQRFASFPWATTRDVVDWAVQAAALLLLFLPSASWWYRR
ncbi:MAG TPA: hypothetical protein VIN75_10595, partial [Burkholderiaceae bacterium]